MAKTTMIVMTVAAVLLLLLLLAGAAASADPTGSRPPRKIGMPNCTTSCGDIKVPYPFGIGPDTSCYLPGFDLTCDNQHDPPRLLIPGIDDLEFQYVGDTLQVLHTIRKLNVGNSTTVSPPLLSGALSRKDSPYRLALGINQLVLTGCNMQSTLLNGNVTESSCFSFCGEQFDNTIDEECSGIGCCHAPMVASGYNAMAYSMKLHRFGQNSSADSQQVPVHAFIALRGWFDYWLSKSPRPSMDVLAAPVSLSWEIGGAASRSKNCVSSSAGCSSHIYCFTSISGYRCRCDSGYHGNPYLPDGCQAIDACESTDCYGDCIPGTEGKPDVCQCPQGTQGNAAISGGCVDSSEIETGKCTRLCGGVQVPYPFGIQNMGPSHCYLPGFNLTCNHTSHHQAPQLLLGENGSLRVLEIHVENATVRAVYHGALINATVILNMEYPFELLGFPSSRRHAAPYSLSTRNELILTGCNTQATLLGNGKPATISGCASFCSHNETTADNHVEARGLPASGSALGVSGGKYCYGMGCCQARISESLDGMPSNLKFGWLLLRRNSESFDDQTPPPTLAFIAEEGWFDHLGFSNELDFNFQPPSRAMREVPIILRWEVLSSKPNCTTSGNICKAKHSYCKSGDRGYTCQCKESYHGNPYVDGDLGCNGGHHKSVVTGISIGVGLASAVGLIIFVLIGRFISNRIKHRNAQMLKLKFFEQNRGQLLKQLVSQRADIAERMIIPVEELEKATNNFDKSRELGGGGHGTVYKGILSDLHVVAIKKPKKVIQREIDEFINEVAILSQINHRNVVKLYGCCLETEVPILVYEFVSNGTLYEHLHMDGPRSLPWDDRLRIAIETAKSLAYLHSTASMPIIHRDVKSANILLDDTLTAKVADFGASRYISVEKSGLTTMVQGTIGYLDPNYFYTGRLTEKSDVYSYGVMLVELLTRKKPFSYLSSEGEGLVAHFASLFAEGDLSQILDPQVVDEGHKEVEEAVALAVACIKLRGEDRPTMRQVELTLEALRPTKDHTSDDFGVNKLKQKGNMINSPPTLVGRSSEGSTRQYSMEVELTLSSRYPR